MKKILVAITAAVMILMLAACGGTADKPAGETPEGESPEQEEAAEESVHPYAWLGLEDIPDGIFDVPDLSGYEKMDI